MEPVLAAEKLLETKLFGFSIKHFGQSFAIPLAPGVVLMVLNMPALFFAPAIFGGMIVGGGVYYRTPPGQNPAQWLIGMLKFKFGPKEYHWKPVQIQGEPIELQDGENGETKTAEKPEDNYETSAMVGDSNTLENLDFEAIHDDGVIETEEKYALIIKITARPWLILDRQSREAVHHSYSQYLMGIKSATQVFTLPVPYDADDYVDHINKTNHNKPDSEIPLLEHGRALHTQWIQNAVKRGKIRDRNHYTIVTSSKLHDNDEMGGSGLLDKFKPGSAAVDEQKQYDELWSRAESVNASLPRTGVNTDIIKERDEALRVLYFYYKGREAPDVMNHGWMTKKQEEEQPQTMEGAFV